MKIYINGVVGHMTKMVAIPIYSKQKLAKISICRIDGPIAMKLGMKHSEFWSIIVCSNYDPRLTLTSFQLRPNLVA